ncbi:hypothetical protein IVB34_40145 [Bradyrhizobium sp. 2]|uniref:hypothetical protein n=1 Tax=unclassified Bradyrhizobium TaxID=2631580 RepID=UPI001FFBADE0|nr:MULTISPECIES: hypothetical protein [unclassified Bradyrhizobium]MCK1447240.1 hypothetical protein [Bradyrhizobium sp. 48]MCK1464403.1 hypothetical protein [Bradyrhizobium sp. 2]
MQPPDETDWRVLVPYDVREGLSLRKAAERAGKSETTLRNWCVQHGLGRRVGDGVWVVSKIALAMYLDGDAKALSLYRNGDRTSEVVKAYFDRCGVPLPFISAQSAKSAKTAV